MPEHDAGGAGQRAQEAGRGREAKEVLDCNSTGHLYNLWPRSLKSAFPGGWGKERKKKTSLTRVRLPWSKGGKR